MFLTGAGACPMHTIHSCSFRHSKMCYVEFVVLRIKQPGFACTQTPSDLTMFNESLIRRRVAGIECVKYCNAQPYRSQSNDLASPWVTVSAYDLPSLLDRSWRKPNRFELFPFLRQRTNICKVGGFIVTLSPHIGCLRLNNDFTSENTS